MPTTAPPPFALRQMVSPAMALTGSDDGAFVPTQIAGCVLWLAADRMGLADGAAVAQWSDLSGQGNHAAQATGANQPTFKAAQINGLPAIYCDGATRYLARTTGSWPQPNTVGLVVQSTGTSDNLSHVAFDGNSVLSFVGKRSPDNFHYMGAGSVINSGVAITGAWQIWTVQYAGATSQLRVSGIQKISANAGTNALTGFRIGYASNNTAPWLGYIAEVVVWNRNLSAAEITAWERYVSTKYAIAVS